MNQIGILVSIFLGGGAGAVLRFSIDLLIGSYLKGGYLPWGILTINLLGSLAMGALTACFGRSHELSPLWSVGLGVGLLGGFTTFSTFSLHLFNLFREGQVTVALTYIFLSVCGGLACVALGYAGVRYIQ